MGNVPDGWRMMMLNRRIATSQIDRRTIRVAQMSYQEHVARGSHKEQEEVNE